jgi:hypothetical protein
MQEIINKRTYNAKHFQNDDGDFTINAHIGHIHYKDSNGDLQESDISFEDKGTYWAMTKHNYKLYINKDFGGDQLIRFDNKYEGANHTIYYEPKMLAWVNATDLSDTQVFRNQQSVTGELVGTNVIRYTNAFGDGIHFEITLMRSGFKKEIIIDAKNKLELPPTTNHKLVALFKYTGDGLNVKNGSTTWDKDAYLEADDGYEICEEANAIYKSFIKPAYILDNGTNKQLIKVFWKKYNNSLWQAKVLPKAFLNNAVYPVRADTTTSYYATAGDGIVTHYHSSGSPTWNDIHDAATGSGADSSSNPDFIQAALNAPEGACKRAFYAFNTGDIGSENTVSSATFYLTGVNVWGVNYIYVDGASQASTSSLATTDFSAVSTTAYSSKITTVNVDHTHYNISLNSTGISAINKTGYTKMSVRSDYDYEDVSPGNNNYGTTFYFSETAGTDLDPYLSVTYAAGGTAANPHHLSSTGVGS